MKKKIIFYIISTVLLLSIGLGGAILFFEKPILKNGTLYVNGTNITNTNVTIRKEKFNNSFLPLPYAFSEKISDLFSKGYYYRADLPLTEVLKSLGMSVEWIDDNTANVTYKNKKYVLDLSKVSMVEVGTKNNLCVPAPGGTRVYTVLDRELILDSDTIENTLYEMGERIDIVIDHDKLTVNIIMRNSTLENIGIIQVKPLNDCGFFYLTAYENNKIITGVTMIKLKYIDIL